MRMIPSESRHFWFQSHSEGAKGFQTAKYRALNVTSPMESRLNASYITFTTDLVQFHVIANPHS